MLNKLFDLSGRVALVTGGSRGLGKAMARGLAEAGAQIAIAARNRSELGRTAKEIGDETGVKVASFEADLSERSQTQQLASAVLAEMGRVDILINNAGSNKVGAIDEIRDEDWDTILELNLSSCMALTRALVPQMKERRWGPGNPHLVDHGDGFQGRTQRLFRQQERAGRHDDGQRPRSGRVWHYR